MYSKQLKDANAINVKEKSSDKEKQENLMEFNQEIEEEELHDYSGGLASNGSWSNR